MNRNKRVRDVAAIVPILSCIASGTSLPSPFGACPDATTGDG